MSKMIASIDLQIEESGKTSATVHCRGKIQTFTLPLSQACNKAMEIIADEFTSFKKKTTCCCGKNAVECAEMGK